MRSRARAVVAALLACALTGAGGRAWADAGPGTFGAQFLNVPVGARAPALGGAFTGLADDVTALAYNPAGLSFLRRQEAGFAYDALAPGVNHEWAGYAHPTRYGTFAAAANAVSVSPFDSYDAFDQPNGQTSSLEAEFKLSYSLALTPFLAIGGSGDYINSRLGNYRAHAAAIDGGVMWKPTRALRFGAAILDAGAVGLRYVSETAGLPTAARAGASWTPYDPKDFPHYFTLTIDGIKPRGEPGYLAGGAELWYARMLALRVGGRSGATAGPGYTLGAGIAVFRGIHSPHELDFDYAFTNSGDFAQTHRVGLTLRFGETLSDEAGAFLRKERTYEEEVLKGRRASSVPKPAEPPPAPAPAPRPRPARAAPPSSPTQISPEYQDWIKP